MDRWKTLLQCWLILVSFFQVVLMERITSEYFTSFINVSYYDHHRGIFHTERTETGRFSSNSAQEVSGLIVELISNITNSIDSSTNINDRSGKFKNSLLNIYTYYIVIVVLLTISNYLLRNR